MSFHLDTVAEPRDWDYERSLRRLYRSIDDGSISRFDPTGSVSPRGVGVLETLKEGQATYVEHIPENGQAALKEEQGNTPQQGYAHATAMLQQEQATIVQGHSAYLQRIHQYAKERDFIHKMQILPMIQDYIFVDYYLRYGEKLKSVTEINKYMLFLGGDEAQNIWAFLREYDITPGKVTPARVIFEIEKLQDGKIVRETLSIKKCWDAPFMNPFKRVIEPATIKAMNKMKAVIKFIYLAAGVAAKPHVFGEDMEFPEIMAAINMLYKSGYRATPIAHMRRPADLSVNLTRPSDFDQLQDLGQLTHPNEALNARNLHQGGILNQGGAFDEFGTFNKEWNSNQVVPFNHIGMLNQVGTFKQGGSFPQADIFEQSGSPNSIADPTFSHNLYVAPNGKHTTATYAALNANGKREYLSDDIYGTTGATRIPNKSSD